MTEDAGTTRAPQAAEYELWSIFDQIAEIAARDESELRRILRPHEEAGLSWELDAPTIALRDRLDRALIKLTFYEVSYQTLQRVSGEPSGASSPGIVVLPIPARASLSVLIRSEAFLHYCDSYLYFAVRFLAHRLCPAESLALEHVEERSKAETHWRPLPLETPPDVTVDKSVFERFIAIQEEPRDYQEEAGIRFLDGFLDRPLDYELWLRGLLSEFDANQEIRFQTVTEGLERWIEKRVRFYLAFALPSPLEASKLDNADGMLLNTELAGQENAARLGRAFSPEVIFQKSPFGQESTGRLLGRRRPAGGWNLKDPVVARLGLADIYWIARLLRATVSSSGSVTYAGTSWLHLLRFRAILRNESEHADTIRQYEEVIRSVFDYVCDLIQNAITVTTQKLQLAINLGEMPNWPPETRKWQHVFNEELGTISLQRKIRKYRSPIGDAQAAPTTAPPEDWSRRITCGDAPLNLVGLAFSGGGIRSATFNLGVLQGLQEFDILRNVDYISTVSGGGFIGSWLVANVRRSAHWLGKVTDWSPSIAHLRNYSNYLAPRTGILSADTWTMAATWLRNTFLIQLTGLAWLFVILLCGLEAEAVFQNLDSYSLYGCSAAELIAFIAGLIITGSLLDNFPGTDRTASLKNRSSKWVRRLTVFPSWIGAFAIGSYFWHDASPKPSRWVSDGQIVGYSTVLKLAWQHWWLLLLLTLIVFAFLASLSLSMKKWKLAAAFVIGIFCTGVLYLGLAGVFCFDVFLAGRKGGPLNWFAFALSPALVLLAFALSVLLLIGLCGRNSNEASREWWTRFGAWLGIYASVGLAVLGVTAFGPRAVELLWSVAHYPAIKWGSILAWLGTVIGGLFAGKSSKTSGEGDSSMKLQALAVIGGALFIAGSALLSSMLLYFVLFKIFSNDAQIDFIASVHGFNRYDLLTGHLSPFELGKMTFGDHPIFLVLVLVLVLGSLFSYFFEINIFGLNQFYHNRIARCYLGASRLSPNSRKPNRFTGFDFKDDIKLHKLNEDPELDEVNGVFRGPFPIINCALNLGGSADLSIKTRHSASFFLTPLRCGSDRPIVGFAPTRSGDSAFADGIMLGQAVAVSGAAVSPNMGYNTSPLVAFLLTMFNVRLGWWFPNPGQESWKNKGLGFSLYYLTRELLGLADERRRFLNVSDGGHFENLAVYELIRRRCKVIIACDAECDEKLQFGGLGNLIRICETDFGATIDIDVRSIRDQKDSHSIAHCAIGQIKYSNGSIGYLIYLKASVTGDEPVGVAQYRSAHPTFPHETTANQFFAEDQFESYRKLGKHVVEHSLRGTVPGQHPVAIAEKLADVLPPAGRPSEVFLEHASALNALWDKFRRAPKLHPFLRELMGKDLPSVAGAPAAAPPAGVVAAAVNQPAGQQANARPPEPPQPVTEAEFCVGLELIQLMEDVFLDLGLDDFWEHPDNRGWAILFMQWSQSRKFREIWGQTRRTFGIRFEHFCAARLGLVRDRPTVRV